MEPEQAAPQSAYSDVSLEFASFSLAPSRSQNIAFSPDGPMRIRVAAPSHLRSDLGRRIEMAAKRLLDVTVAAALFILLSPGLLLIAAAIKMTSPGPIIFRQQRYGLGGKQFEIFKFRTMCAIAGDRSGRMQTRPNDSRVTPIGRFLRKSSLDELPQLLNVLRGDMSLVGPRPHVPGMLAGGMLYEDLVPEYFERLRVLPGVTGLAQVNGLRGSTEDATTARARIANDLAYAENWSLALDLKIILKTAQCEFLSGTGL